MKRVISLSILCLAVVILVAPSSAPAQSTTTGTTATSTVVYPQDNVAGGAVGARRPGLRVAAGLAEHSTRMSIDLQQHGGATPQPDTSVARHTLLLNDVLTSLFNTLNQLATALALAAGVSTTTGT